MRSALRTLTLLTALLLVFSEQAAAHGFNYDEVYLAYLKLAPPSDWDKATDDYMSLLQGDMWGRAKRNELEWPTASKNAKERLKALVAKFNLSEPFEFVSKGEFGAYDPQSQTFEFSGADSNGSFFPYGGGAFAPQLSVTFLNGFEFRKIKVPADLARETIDNSYRQVEFSVTFVMVQSYAGTGRIKARIKSITFSDPFKHRTLATLTAR